MRKLQPLVELILKILPIDTLTALPTATRISALHHEVLDDPVENSLVVVALHAKLDEIATGTRRLTSPEIDFQVSIVGF